MVTLLTIIHVSVCIFLIAIVLLQHGKGADMGASFGGGSSQTVFGTDGPIPLLNKITTMAAVVFMFTSVVLAYYSANITKGSVMTNVRPAPPPIEQPIEVAPTPVEVPLSRTGSDAGQEAGGDVNAQFPGNADAKFPGEPSAAMPTGEGNVPPETNK